MKRSRKKHAITTNEAVEMLLGRKAAKRLRQLATRVADADAEAARKDKQRKHKKKKDKKSGKSANAK